MAAMIGAMWQALGGDASAIEDVETVGAGALPSVFDVTGLAASSIGVASMAIAELVALRYGDRPKVRIDRRLASRWFGISVEPIGWSLPAPWDPIAGDYAAADGWIRLHTNAPHHRAVALLVLGVSADKESVAKAVAAWRAEELESLIVERDGCAAVMRSVAEWQAHPQGRTLVNEPLIALAQAGGASEPRWQIPRSRPLRGIRVLDLTRVLAGPVATRFLAGFGADVLRIDPPGWEEPSIVPDVTPGKRCARLDLRTSSGRGVFERLLADADVFVHGYRSDALERLGFGAAWRRQLNPSLIDMALDAYGWSGPWRTRRGFDSLVQMSTGIAEAGMRHYAKDRPTPLPVQALDHATGYLMAAAVVRGLTNRLSGGTGMVARTSLAQMARFLIDRSSAGIETPLAPDAGSDYGDVLEQTEWGPMRRLIPPVSVSGTPMFWERPAEGLGRSDAVWPLSSVY